MKTAIVILNWNGVKLLEQFLPSVVMHSSQQAEVYVADNASTDTSVNFVKEHFPSVKIIQNKDNGGYAKGYNDALQRIEADILCLVNSDIEVTENWLTPIITTFSSEQNTAIVQPKILDFKDKTKFEYAGAGGGFIDAFGYPYCRGRIFSDLETDSGQFDDTTNIFWGSGACFFIRSSVFNELKGFDEDFFAHQEEIDLCWRATNKGYDVKYVGASTVYHVGGATLDTLNPKKTYLNFRNSLLNLVKNLPTSRLFPVIFSRLVLDGVAGIKFLIELKPKHLFAILKAHFSFYKNLFKFLKKRGKTTKSSKYFLHKSIVWQYYALGKKKFTDLKN
ncbi:glycosyltransferase, family GT2 [Tenacibaculum sp. 190130A14a]|uniref:Glycosyltransferase family 2 protein n=1 Tax=Tenacibaculum polynesiense TaxID=3137857 RepID=A0ABM9P8U9_9FLAO